MRVGEDPGDRRRGAGQSRRPWSETQQHSVPSLFFLPTLILIPIAPTDMDGWTKLQSGLAGLNLGQSANKFAKGLQSSVQATRERLGQVAPEEITELPQGVCSSG